MARQRKAPPSGPAARPGRNAANPPPPSSTAYRMAAVVKFPTWSGSRRNTPKFRSGAGSGRFHEASIASARAPAAAIVSSSAASRYATARMPTMAAVAAATLVSAK